MAGTIHRNDLKSFVSGPKRLSGMGSGCARKKDGAGCSSPIPGTEKRGASRMSAVKWLEKAVDHKKRTDGMKRSW